MKVRLHTHHGGEKVIGSPLAKPLQKALEELRTPFTHNGGTKVRKAILAELPRLGWSKSVKLDTEAGITVTAMNSGVALCLQFGNMSRFYADILKLQFLHEKKRASAAIFILPTKAAADQIASNIANSERLRRELTLFKNIITIPIMIMAVEEDDK